MPGLKAKIRKARKRKTRKPTKNSLIKNPMNEI